MDGTALANSRVLDLEDRWVRLGSLWEARPTVLVWLRHFGCAFCRKQAADFAKRQEQLDQSGAGLAFIGCGAPPFAKSFRTEFAPGCTVLSDPQRATYGLIDAPRGLVATIGPQTWAARIQLRRAGFHQGEVGQGDRLQMGGVLVVRPGDEIAFRFVSRSANDQPDVDAVVAAAREAAAATV
jgi:peroxiredoxin